MSLTQRESVNIKWAKAAKGKGLRWQMMREVLAISTIMPLQISYLKSIMTTMRGIKRNTTQDLLDELEQAGMIKQEVIPPMEGFCWIPTPLGQEMFQLAEDTIPAGIVQVVLTMTNALDSKKKGSA